MKKVLIVTCCLISFQSIAQKKIVDSVQKNIPDTVKKDLLTVPDTVKKLHSKVWPFVAPAAFITYGALSFEVNPIRRFDYDIRNDIARTNPNFHTKAESYFQFAPIVMVYGLNFIGVPGKNTFIDRSALIGLTAVILGVSATATKHFTHRLRPNSADRLSFPSGHTSVAFAGATFLAEEYGDKSPVYTVVGYSFAVATGVFRLYNRAHWFSDVVAGAGFGILSAKAAYLVYPYIHNALTHKDQNGKITLIMPTYQDGVPGLSFTKVF